MNADQVEEPSSARRLRLTGAGGVGVLIAVTAIGALIDGLARGGPGLVLDVSVVVGAVVAAMAISSRLVWLIVPLPPLVFAAMAVAAGVIADQGTTRSTTRLGGAAATWVAKGFVAMMSATLLAMMIAIVRSANRRL